MHEYKWFDSSWRNITLKKYTFLITPKAKIKQIILGVHYIFTSSVDKSISTTYINRLHSCLDLIAHFVKFK